MPRGNGTGPLGEGPMTGRGMGGGGGRMGGMGLGVNGNCVCPKCGKTVPHQTGTPCTKVACPECGGKMTRAVTS